MDIEKKLEALTHTVELLAGMQIETEKKLARLVETVTDLAVSVARVDDGIGRVVNILANHEDRIRNLERP